MARGAIGPSRLRNGSGALSSRSLSSTIVMSAPRAPPRAPIIRQKERSARNAQQYGPDDINYPWPTGLLERASRDGILPFSALRATVVLDDFAILRFNGTVGRREKVMGVMKRKFAAEARIGQGLGPRGR